MRKETCLFGDTMDRARLFVPLLMLCAKLHISRHVQSFLWNCIFHWTSKKNNIPEKCRRKDTFGFFQTITSKFVLRVDVTWSVILKGLKMGWNLTFIKFYVLRWGAWMCFIEPDGNVPVSGRPDISLCSEELDRLVGPPDPQTSLTPGSDPFLCGSKSRTVWGTKERERERERARRGPTRRVCGLKYLIEADKEEGM